jgi:hypothetical protein
MVRPLLDIFEIPAAVVGCFAAIERDNHVEPDCKKTRGRKLLYSQFVKTHGPYGLRRLS